MPPPLKLTGKRFGRLEVIAQAPTRNQKTYWVTQCDCGKRTVKLGANLTSGETKSCGCGMNASRYAGSRVPQKGECHPLVIELFKRINFEQARIEDVVKRSGLGACTMGHWRNRRAPRLPDFEAAVNALGGRLIIRWDAE